MNGIKADELESEVPVETVELGAEVIWTGVPDEEVIPEITINLMSGKEVVERIAVTDGATEVKFTPVDELDAAGNVILYTIEQEPIENYETEVREFIIENTYIAPLVEEPAAIESESIPDEEPELEEPLLEEKEESIEESKDEDGSENEEPITEELIVEEPIVEEEPTKEEAVEEENQIEDPAYEEEVDESISDVLVREGLPEGSEVVTGIDGELGKDVAGAPIHITLAGSELKSNLFMNSRVGVSTVSSNSPTLPGQVTIDKYAVPVPGLVNTWDVTLRIEGMDSQKTSDIVLLIDRSGSMGDNQKLSKAKTAAIAFVNAMADKANTRIAVVSFASNHSGSTTTQHVGFTSPNTQTNRNTLINAINSLSANGATHTQAGIKRAAELIDSSNADFKHLILLSDGEPTQSYLINDNSNTATYEAFGGTARADYGGGSSSVSTIHYRSRSNFTASEFNYNTTVGYGNYSYTYRGSIGSTDYFYSHGNSAIAQAAMFKAQGGGRTLWTIALETTNYGDEVLEDISSPGKDFQSTPDQLNAIFLQIAGSINSAAKDIVVVDPMGEGFEIPVVVNSNITKSQGTHTYANRVLTWNVGDLTQPISPGSNIKVAWLKYRVTINDDILSLPVPGDGRYPTNGDAKVTYKDQDDVSKIKTFPVPKVNPIFIKVKKVLLDAEGNIITDPSRQFPIKIMSDAADGDTIYAEYNETYSLIPDQQIIKTNLRLADTYTVSENAPDYDVTIKVNGVVTDTFVVQPPAGSADSGQPDIEVLVTNKEKPLGKLILKKILLDENNNPIVGDQREFTFNITGPGNYSETRVLKGGETKEITGLKYGQYTVTEADQVSLVAEGFTITSDPADGVVTLGWNNKTGTVRITNKYISPKIDVIAKKIWQNGNVEDHVAVALTLYRQVGAGPKTVVAGVTPNIIPASGTASQFTYTWSNLPKTNQFGQLYTYTVDELTVPAGYDKIISEDGLTVTNKSKTSKLQLLKTGVDDAPLEGAKFDLYRKTEGSAEGAVAFENEDGETVFGVLISVGSLITDENGETQIIDGLEAGDYFVIETAAPVGYLLHEYPIEFEIDAAKTLNKFTVENELAPMIPATGGMGTMLFSIIGISIMGGALLGFKKFNNNNRGKGESIMKGRKLFTVLFTMLVLFVFVAPAMAKATEVPERTTNVTIHKMELFTNPEGLPADHDGTVLDEDGLDEVLGAGNYAPLEGVVFRYWKVPATADADDLDDMDLSELITDFGNGTITTATLANGTVALPPLADGYYYFREHSAPEVVTDQIAVPFLLGLPVMKADGTGFIKDLHIYPKNLTVRGAVVLTKLAGNAKLPGVTFDLYKGVPGNSTLRTEDLVTDANGEIIINNLPVGSYYFVETATVSPYLLDATPIPFTITANGKATVVAGERVVTGDVKLVTHDNFVEPDIEKFIGTVGQTAASGNFNEALPFIIDVELPGNIQKYDSLVVSDDLDSRLDYRNSLEVLGSTDGITFTPLALGTDYTVTEPALGSHEELVVTFEPEELEGLKFIRVKFEASINETAIMGQGIPNKAVVEYNNGFVVDEEPSEEVLAFTGGKNFIKVNGDAEALDGAEFVIMNADNEYLVIEDGVYSWTTDMDDAYTVVSDEYGLFEIKGLKYDLEDGTVYFLYETVAPMSSEGYPYQLIEDPIDFLVNGSSYYSNPGTIELGSQDPTADPQEVLNILGPQIPQTGGIGTTLFTLIGGGLMGSALILNKKRSKG